MDAAAVSLAGLRAAALQDALCLSSSRRRAALRLRPARLMKSCTIRIAEPSPPGDTLLRAMILATSSPGLVNVPLGGKVDSVLT